MDKPQQALADADKVTELNPNYARAFLSRGRALEKLGNKYEALAAYRRFLNTGNPDTDGPLLQQALGRIKALEASK